MVFKYNSTHPSATSAPSSRSGISICSSGGVCSSGSGSGSAGGAGEGVGVGLGVGFGFGTCSVHVEEGTVPEAKISVVVVQPWPARSPDSVQIVA